MKTFSLANWIRFAVVPRIGSRSRTVRLQPVRVGRNLGQSIEVLEGVKPADVLVLNPSDSIAEGDKVVIEAPASAASAAKGAP